MQLKTAIHSGELPSVQVLLLLTRLLFPSCRGTAWQPLAVAEAYMDLDPQVFSLLSGLENSNRSSRTAFQLICCR